MDVIGINYKYQWRVTKLFRRLSSAYDLIGLNTVELALHSILYFCKFAQSRKLADVLIQSRVVFLNNRICLNVFRQLQAGDVVQLQTTYAMYAHVFQNFIIQNDRFFKFFYHIRNVGLLDRFDDRVNFSADVFIANRFNMIRVSNNKLRDLFIGFYSTPRFVEVDYLTLTIAVITTPTALSEFNKLLVRQYAFGYIKMLN